MGYAMRSGLISQALEVPGIDWRKFRALACFRVPFTCLWIGRLGSPVRKASANVRECPDLSKKLLKCARSPCPHVRSFASNCRVTNSNPSFGQESLCREPRFLLLFRSPCPHVRSFASNCRVTNSNPSFGQESLCREPVGQNGVLTSAIVPDSVVLGFVVRSFS
ncbi:hypothetical protein CRG98_021467 [Punica granatum]|uniref:Uncharacterized protein n=1 Tax=Punica granatum TaxID=22663 RepID=A0A2I0JPA4_PUNGR|nr:hypothetical protein CRG98_021467 [Punica granatum]